MIRYEPNMNVLFTFTIKIIYENLCKSHLLKPYESHLLRAKVPRASCYIWKMNLNVLVAHCIVILFLILTVCVCIHTYIQVLCFCFECARDIFILILVLARLPRIQMTLCNMSYRFLFCVCTLYSLCLWLIILLIFWITCEFISFYYNISFYKTYVFNICFDKKKSW